MTKKTILCILLAIILIAIFSDAKIAELNTTPQFPKTKAQRIADGTITDNPILIESEKELRSIPNGSDKNYLLMTDLDMGKEVWTPIDFKGSFDGNNHTISNLFIEGTSEEIELTYDGNMKVYDTLSSGMFGVLDDASVKNLNLKDLKLKVVTDDECIFAGAIAGFVKDSVIENVELNGTAFLKTSSKCFGLGGIAGYGRGLITSCKADMTLISIDANAKEKDEQFMGGAYAAGRIDLIGNEIIIDGYDSDHGYVHDGGLVGMYIHYDEDLTGAIDENIVKGKIRFFEDNRDRRAYCAPYVGEMMSWNLSMNNNKSDFIRDEVFEYTVDLFPDNYEEY